MIAAIYQISDHDKIALIWSYYKNEGMQGVFTALAAISGGRVLGTYTTITEIISYPFGFGANPDFLIHTKESVSQFQVQGYNTKVSSTPVSGILSFVYVFGIFGLGLLSFLISKCVSNSKIRFETLVIILLGILYSPPSSPIWIIAVIQSMQKKLIYQIQSSDSNQNSTKDIHI